VLPDDFVQLKLVSIDEIRVSLAEWGGFRKFFKSKATDIGLRGYIWRVPITHAAVVATGSKVQIDMLIDFVKELKEHMFIQTFVVERPTQPILTPTFDILPSRRRGVTTGLYSEKELDEVASQSSADTPEMFLDDAC
jgi:acylphosphatase